MKPGATVASTALAAVPASGMAPTADAGSLRAPVNCVIVSRPPLSASASAVRPPAYATSADRARRVDGHREFDATRRVDRRLDVGRVLVDRERQADRVPAGPEPAGAHDRHALARGAHRAARRASGPHRLAALHEPLDESGEIVRHVHLVELEPPDAGIGLEFDLVDGQVASGRRAGRRRGARALRVALERAAVGGAEVIRRDVTAAHEPGEAARLPKADLADLHGIASLLQRRGIAPDASLIIRSPQPARPS